MRVRYKVSRRLDRQMHTYVRWLGSSETWEKEGRYYIWDIWDGRDSFSRKLSVHELKILGNGIKQHELPVYHVHWRGGILPS